MAIRSHIYDLNHLHTPIPVASDSEFKHAMNNANPGDVIALSNGSYELGDFIMTRAGNASNPIVIRAGESRNGARIRNQSKLTISGTWVYIEGLKFIDSYIRLRHDGRGGGQCRITRCQFLNGDRSEGLIDIQDSSENRIDHCEFGPRSSDRPLSATQDNYRTRLSE